MRVTVVEFNSYKLRAAIKEHGQTNESVSIALGRNRYYISNCIYSGKINLEYLEVVSKMLGTPVDVFLDLSPVEPVVEKPDPEPEPEPTGISLDDHGTEALMKAIVNQAKNDWLMAYHDEIKRVYAKVPAEGAADNKPYRMGVETLLVSADFDW